MDLNHILVAVNAVNGRDAAFARALALARSSGAELYLLHAVPLNQRFSFGATERVKQLADMRRRAQDAGVSIRTVEQTGDPAEIIELHATARGSDLIVIGAEARRWRKRSPVAERVIRRVNVPTLVVASDAPDDPSPFRNVLVAVDLSPASQDVVNGALALTTGDAAQLTVVHTVNSIEAADAVHSAARWMVPEYRAYALEDARRALEAVVSTVPAGVDTRAEVWTGSATGTILERAAAVNADLVVAGRSRGFKVFGSTALRLLRRNEGALLIVPGDARRASRVERQLAA